MSVSVALLLPGVGSVVPPGGATVAVFDQDPVALADTVPVSVNVAVPPTSRLTGALMLPLPIRGTAAARRGRRRSRSRRLIVAGSVSATVAPVTALGPLLVATIVYVIGLPGVAVGDCRRSW